MMSRMIGASIATLLCGMLVSGDVFACSVSGLQPFVIDETLGPDTLPVPDAVTLEVTSITRGHPGKLLEDGSGLLNSCDDIGFIEMRVPGAVQELGYEYVLVEGMLPEGAALPDMPIHQEMDGGSWIAWVDGRSQEQEEISFWVTITPVNRAGVRGAVSEPVHIYDPGRPARSEQEEEDRVMGDCHQAGTPVGGPPPPWLCMVGMMSAWVWRRRLLR